MTLEELKAILDQTGFPVAYSHFNETDDVPPQPPFIAYLVTGSNNFFADEKVYKRIDSINVELYTSIKDELAEKKVEDLLTANGIAYQKDESWIQAEKLFLQIYDFDIIVTEEYNNKKIGVNI
ncbi:hypothetical protein DFO70_11144 [Cytobacillus firmus]|uniref:Uncharacterized protein n=2 Tax=Cytobacillus TaxID=2675230 RepID=A0A366JPJ6_CYTFI|nr:MULTISPECIES: hypothetical protein [Cytobacillus]RBP89397.1 hypothetical protein DFO70_11144 [Cytobacillus firmus]TDX47376.1 hypothetical protein DFO72_101473 [Cytobacillus oceanisediminis]